mmetsp:Transcript_12438/g.29269  ORF Transcript_12438/g.29269 Transcript_12438/m.29269 type:complete len:227 (-) Transcript_12438:269-949(-)
MSTQIICLTFGIRPICLTFGGLERSDPLMSCTKGCRSDASGMPTPQTWNTIASSTTAYRKAPTKTTIATVCRMDPDGSKRLSRFESARRSTPPFVSRCWGMCWGDLPGGTRGRRFSRLGLGGGFQVPAKGCPVAARTAHRARCPSWSRRAGRTRPSAPCSSPPAPLRALRWSRCFWWSRWLRAPASDRPRPQQLSSSSPAVSRWTQRHPQVSALARRAMGRCEWVT